jgi:hypothetical protein
MDSALNSKEAQMVNFILLLGMAVGIAGLTALAIISGLKWLSANPAAFIGMGIGAVIAIVATLKVKSLQDEELVRRYQKHRESEPIAQPIRRQKPIEQPVHKKEHDTVRIKELAEALGKLGYTMKDSKEAINFVLQDEPDLSDEGVVTAAIHYLSDSRVGT